MTRIDTENLEELVEIAWATEFTPEEKRRYTQWWMNDDKEEVRRLAGEQFDDKFADDIKNRDEAREVFINTFTELLEQEC
jgi:hypothetical protein